MTLREEIRRMAVERARAINKPAAADYFEELAHAAIKAVLEREPSHAVLCRQHGYSPASQFRGGIPENWKDNYRRMTAQLLKELETK